MKKILLLIAVLLCYNIGFSQGSFTSDATGNWNASGTWSLDSGSDTDGVPDADDTVTIGSGHTVTVTAAAACTTLTNNGTKMTVEADLTVSGDVTLTTVSWLNGGDLIVSGDLANSGVLRIYPGYYLQLDGSTKTLTNTGEIDARGGEDSFSRIIVAGTIADSGGADNSYQRWVNGTGDAGTSTGWDLVGVPTSNTSITNTIDENTDIASTNSGTSILYGVGFYDSDDNDWHTYGGSATANNYASAGNFTVGKGYQMATGIALNGTGAAIEFTGNLNSGDINATIQNYDLDDDSDMSDGSRFNLVANPYLTFLYANDNTDGTNNLISVNGSSGGNVLHANGQAVYMWDGDSYVTVNHSTTSSYQYLAPYQGFMVMARTTGSNTNFSFTKAMQTTSGANDPIADGIMDPVDNAELFIGISQNGKNRKTEIYFSENGTDGLDPGYDAQEFPNSYPSTSTRLIQTIESTDGVNFSIQTLSYDEMWDKVIPLVVNAEAGSEVVLDINHNTAPYELNIYLEDAVEGTFTNLKENNFVITPTENLEGAGRFYIHLTADALSNEEVNTSLLNAYKGVDNNYITIEGLATQLTSTEASLYNILGTKVMDTTLDNTTNTQMVSTNGLSTGIYVLKLVSGENQLTKKLIIK